MPQSRQTRREEMRSTTTSSGTSRLMARSIPRSATRSLQVVGLAGRAGEPVEQPPTDGVVLGEPLLDEPDHDVVGQEVPGVHELLGLAAELGAVLDRGAEHVAGRDVRDAVTGQPGATPACPFRRPDGRR